MIILIHRRLSTTLDTESSIGIIIGIIIEGCLVILDETDEEDYDETDDSNINERHLYILSIQCKTIFVKLLTKFTRKYCWFNCKNVAKNIQIQISNYCASSTTNYLPRVI